MVATVPKSVQLSDNAPPRKRPPVRQSKHKVFRSVHGCPRQHGTVRGRSAPLESSPARHHPHDLRKVGETSLGTICQTVPIFCRLRLAISACTTKRSHASLRLGPLGGGKSFCAHDYRVTNDWFFATQKIRQTPWA